jgi:8-oxo-dGTP pyrophosphatase MutT (NUDIX family)
MKEKPHPGVGVIITNKSHTKFYLQQKDNTHPVTQCRLKFCFFGGAVEEGESELEALKRELTEEINKEVAVKISSKTKRLFDSTFLNILGIPTIFVFYEMILSDEELLNLSKIPVKEGKGGFLVGIKEMYTLPFIIDLEHMLRRYLGMINCQNFH